MAKRKISLCAGVDADRLDGYEVLMEAASRYVAEKRPRLESPDEVAKFMLPLTLDLKQETAWVLSLSPRHHLLNLQAVTVGLQDRASIHAREVFRSAILANAHTVILVHNHPSGDATPSPDDLRCSRSMKAAGDLLDINLLDFLIIGVKTKDEGRKWFVSLKEEGIL